MNLSELLSNVTLNDWQRSQLRGVTSTGIRCLLDGWFSQSPSKLHFEGSFCNTTWDGEGQSCWPTASVGETVTLPCSEVMRFDGRIDPLVLVGEVTRRCSHNGSWYSENQTDYSTCLDSLEDNLRRLRMKATPFKYVVRYILYCGSISSILCLLASLFIFYYFKSIRCNRITVHVNMMLTLLFRCVTIVFMTHPTVFKGSYSFRQVDWFCKLVYCLQFYFTVASIHWMFVQGHFLNSKLTTNILMKKFPIKTYIGIGWGIPLVIIGVWGIATETLYETRCWKNFGKLPTIWILVVPMTAVLLINVLLLVNILRVVITKTHTYSGNSVATKSAMRYQTGVHIKRGTKATAVLFPLLGMANLIFFYNPGGEGQKYYMVANASIQSFQGIVASVLYCFICKDVRDAIRREYYRYRITQASSLRRGSTNRTVSFSSRDSNFSCRIHRVQQVTQQTCTSGTDVQEDY